MSVCFVFCLSGSSSGWDFALSSPPPPVPRQIFFLLFTTLLMGSHKPRQRLKFTQPQDGNLGPDVSSQAVPVLLFSNITILKRDTHAAHKHKHTLACLLLPPVTIRSAGYLVKERTHDSPHV